MKMRSSQIRWEQNESAMGNQVYSAWCNVCVIHTWWMNGMGKVGGICLFAQAKPCIVVHAEDPQFKVFIDTGYWGGRKLNALSFCIMTETKTLKVMKPKKYGKIWLGIRHYFWVDIKSECMKPHESSPANAEANLSGSSLCNLCMHVCCDRWRQLQLNSIAVRKNRNIYAQ